MSILRANAPRVKVGDSPPGACPRCRGSGVQPGTPSADPAPCGLCDGYGRLRLVERRAPEPEPAFKVCVGDGLVETGARLEDLVRQVCREWPDSADDLAVWDVTHEDRCRLVAVVRPGTCGPLVTYL